MRNVLTNYTTAAEKKIVVAFGGTVARNPKDWISDIRWFIPHHRDQYTMIVDRLGKEFIAKADWLRSSPIPCRKATSCIL